MPRGFRVEGAEELRLLAVELKMARPELARGLRKALVETVKPIVPEVRSAALSIPTSGGGGFGAGAADRAIHTVGRSRAKNQTRVVNRALGGSGLRARIAAAVKSVVRVSTSSVAVYLKVDASQFPDDQRILPKYMDGIGRWRHPTYGHDPWVQQDAHPYFRKTIEPHIPEVELRVRAVMTEVARAAGFH